VPELTIEEIGAKGDGIARENGQLHHVPFTLPDERISAQKIDGALVATHILEPSPDRITPPCIHFGLCGGCQVQHMEKTAYLRWKTQLVENTLARHGIETPIEEMRSFPPASRRKCAFSLERKANGVILGFVDHSVQCVLDLSQCHVLTPLLQRQLSVLRSLFDCLPVSANRYKLSVLQCNNGVDLALEGRALPSAVQKTLMKRVVEQGFCRLAINGEILIEPIKPFIELGFTTVSPPPGAFVQAVQSAQNTMVEIISTHLKGTKNIADLFSGIGTFTLPLAQQSTVHACEENAAALACLEHGWRETGGKLKTVTLETRNLERRPLSTKELKRFDGLVFDPPRAGAQAQARQIAKAEIPKVAAISCNSVTLARDLEILLDGGYRIDRIIPLDQFCWTHHVEVVALLSKKRTRVRKGF